MIAHPDIAAAAGYWQEAVRFMALSVQALRGKATAGVVVSIDLAAAQASRANPYGTYVSPYTAGSPAEVAEGVPGWPPAGHLAQHKGGCEECTSAGCCQPSHRLHAASIAGGTR